MSQYDLTDFEWRVIEPLLPNKPRGVPHPGADQGTRRYAQHPGEEQQLIERFFSKLKHFRRVATRYDKFAANFLAMVYLASMRLWLRAYESTA